MSLIESQGNESPKTDADIVSAIGDHEWSQGDVLPGVLATQVLSAPEIASGAIAVVVSHDCDLIHGNLKNEPCAEILLLRPTKLQGDMTQAKNPRRIHLPASASGSVVYFEALAHDRRFIDRRLLSQAAPLKGTFDVEAREDLKQWLAKRYVRAAFPSEFDNRTRDVRKKIKKALDTVEGKSLSGLYILFNTDKELPAGTPYKIIIRGTMKAVVFDEQPLVKKCEVLVGKMAALLSSCAGIEVLDHGVTSEARFSLDEVRLSKRWDADFLSADGSDEPAVL